MPQFCAHCIYLLHVWICRLLMNNRWHLIRHFSALVSYWTIRTRKVCVLVTFQGFIALCLEVVHWILVKAEFPFVCLVKSLVVDLTQSNEKVAMWHQKNIFSTIIWYAQNLCSAVSRLFASCGLAVTDLRLCLHQCHCYLYLMSSVMTWYCASLVVWLFYK